VKRWILVVALALSLTGCGAYAAAFTPSESLPSSDDIAGTWVADNGGFVELSVDGTFTTENTDAPSGSGTWSTPEQPSSPFPYYLLTYGTGSSVQLHHQNGFLGDENLYFVRGVVDDGDWYRLYRAED
jgi:hypothetical protein